MTPEGGPVELPHKANGGQLDLPPGQGIGAGESGQHRQAGASRDQCENRPQVRHDDRRGRIQLLTQDLTGIPPHDGQVLVKGDPGKRRQIGSGAR